MRKIILLLPIAAAAAATAALSLFLSALPVHANPTANGFDLSHTTIPADEIFHGGPPRDGIPAIDNPVFVPTAAAGYLHDEDIILGLVQNGVARAYPTRIFVWHEIVNDVIAGMPVAVTYCPLCGTGMAFSRNVGGDVRSFGVSGLLYQSDVLMYDRQSESLWSQLARAGVSGEAAGLTLTWIPAEHMTWRAWREKYPDGEVLSTDTGFFRHYAGDGPYESYFASDAIIFPVPQTRRELANKESVAGVIINGEAMAYPLSALPENTAVADTVGGENITILYQPTAKNPQIRDADGQPVPFVVAFWFAWQAFYPATGLWQP